MHRWSHVIPRERFPVPQRELICRLAAGLDAVAHRLCQFELECPHGVEIRLLLRVVRAGAVFRVFHPLWAVSPAVVRFVGVWVVHVLILFRIVRVCAEFVDVLQYQLQLCDVFADARPLLAHQRERFRGRAVEGRADLVCGEAEVPV